MTECPMSKQYLEKGEMRTRHAFDEMRPKSPYKRNLKLPKRYKEMRKNLILTTLLSVNKFRYLILLSRKYLVSALSIWVSFYFRAS